MVSESRQKAVAKYNEAHRAEINEKMRIRMMERYKTDPEFRAKKLAYTAQKRAEKKLVEPVS